ncbi:MAG: hypothetical protein ACMXYC_04220 [Candidatus Woesearchaeota archaeon]
MSTLEQLSTTTTPLVVVDNMVYAPGSHPSPHFMSAHGSILYYHPHQRVDKLCEPQTDDEPIEVKLIKEIHQEFLGQYFVHQKRKASFALTHIQVPNAVIYNNHWYALEAHKKGAISIGGKTYTTKKRIAQPEVKRHESQKQSLRTSYKEFSLDGIIGSHAVFINLHIPAHVYEHQGTFYKFEQCTAQVPLSRHGRKYKIHNTQISEPSNYKHSFVYSSSLICFNGPQRFAQRNISFDTPYPIDNEFIKKVCFVLVESRRTLLSGHFDNPNEAQKFPTLTSCIVSEREAKKYPIHKC